MGRKPISSLWEGRWVGGSLRLGEAGAGEGGGQEGGSGVRCPLGILAPSHWASDLTSCASVYLSVK